MLHSKCSNEAASVAGGDKKEVLLFSTAACEPETTAAKEPQGTPISVESHRIIKLLLMVIVAAGDARIPLSDAQVIVNK